MNSLHDGSGAAFVVVSEHSAWAAAQAAITTLIAMMQHHDPATAAHMERVGALAARIAEQLGCNPALCDQIALGGRLHDIGKLAIAPSVLHSPASLPPLEQHRMQRHPVIGEHLTSILPLPPLVVSIIRRHHERLDGSGYPDGLTAADSDLPARIVAVADAFDAMTNPRPYCPLRSPQEALAVLHAEAGIVWDAEVVAALATVLGVAVEPGALSARAA
jgi:HD-GYP domain-containing protein (c-di-GMP phosphodiesterase class II)